MRCARDASGPTSTTRLSVFSILVPPLREMGRDRQELLEHFRQRYAQQSHLPPFRLDEPARALWDGYAFPGNVRELRNIVIRLTAKYPGQTVTAEQLAGELDLPQPDTGPRQDQPVTPDIRAAREHLQQAPAGFGPGPAPGPLGKSLCGGRPADHPRAT